MTSEYANFRLGAFDSPLTAATTNSLLQDADPALYAITNFYQAILETHLGARFDAEITRLDLPSTLLGGLTRVTYPYDPIPMLQQMKATPPWMAIYRTDEIPNEVTRNWYDIASHVQVQYVLPALSPAQYIGMSPMLQAIRSVILDRTVQGYDPTYLPDSDNPNGQLVFKVGGIEEIEITKVSFGGVKDPNTNLFLPMMLMDITMKEQKNPTPNLQPLAGIDNTISIVDSTGSEEFIDMSVNT